MNLINVAKMTVVKRAAPAPGGSHCLTWECIYRRSRCSGSGTQWLSWADTCSEKAPCPSECGPAVFKGMAQMLCRPASSWILLPLSYAATCPRVCVTVYWAPQSLGSWLISAPPATSTWLNILVDNEWAEISEGPRTVDFSAPQCSSCKTEWWP